MQKKGFKIPTTCALLFILMMIAAVLTWVIPAGEYEMEKVGNITRVIAGTYHTVESNPQGLWALFTAVPAGFYKTAKMLFSIMFIGGAVEVLEKSGSFHVVFGRIAKRNLNIRLLVFLIMLFMTIGGAAGVFSNATIALIPIGITLALSLAGLLVAIGALLIGCITAGWSHEEIASIFFALAVYLGLLNNMGINGTTKVFLDGCSKMVNAAFITGFANGISVLMTNGRILNTIVYWLSIPMGTLGLCSGSQFHVCCESVY